MTVGVGGREEEEEREKGEERGRRKRTDSVPASVDRSIFSALISPLCTFHFLTVPFSCHTHYQETNCPLSLPSQRREGQHACVPGATVTQNGPTSRFKYVSLLRNDFSYRCQSRPVVLDNSLPTPDHRSKDCCSGIRHVVSFTSSFVIRSCFM